MEALPVLSAHRDMQTDPKMTQSETTYDVRRPSLEEIRAWLLTQSALLPHVHRMPKSEQQIRDANTSTLSLHLMHSFESASRLSEIAMSAARGFVSTNLSAPSLASLGPSSESSISESLEEPLRSTCSVPSDEVNAGVESPLACSKVWQSKPKECSYLASTSSSHHSVLRPCEFFYDMVVGTPANSTISPDLSTSHEIKPNSSEPLPVDGHNFLSMEYESKLPSPPIPATLSIEQYRKAAKEQVDPLLSQKCMLGTCEGLQQQPLMLVGNEQTEMFSSRSREEAIQDSTQETLAILDSTFPIIHPQEQHETVLPQLLDEHCKGRDQEFLSCNSKVYSVCMEPAKPDSPRKAGSGKEEMGALTMLQLSRKETFSSRVGNRSLSPTSSTTSSSSNSSNSTYPRAPSSLLDPLNTLQGRGKTCAILACVAAILSIFLVTNYKKHLEEFEGHSPWWT